MYDTLTTEELTALVTAVFSLKRTDHKLAFLLDVPDKTVKDTDVWRIRRRMTKDWQQKLKSVKSGLNLDEVNIIFYPNVHSNNADLPEIGYFYSEDIEDVSAENLIQKGLPVRLKDIMTTHQIFFALTQLSATAPLKLLAPQYGFRAATMPGFRREMLPSLKLDYEEINARIMKIKHILDPATGMEIEFQLDTGEIHHIYFDLRFRTATSSGGRFPDPGKAGNLPGGECYIVPYEGEKGAQSKSSGTLPVQFDDEIVIYKIEQNVAVDILSSGEYSSSELKKIKEEPAYANIAELGFGILRYFGIKPINEVLLDEKLGLHIAFGRSDHFGGAIGIKDFTKPENVIHIDRLYIPEIQNRIQVNYVRILHENSSPVEVIKNDDYTIF
jgi:hypothetical protein